MSMLASRGGAPPLLDVHDVGIRVPNNRWDVEGVSPESRAWARVEKSTTPRNRHER